MPSPFPGMDAYLEHPTVWPGVHHLLISGAAEALQPVLRARGYHVTIGERVRLTDVDPEFLPDNLVLTSRQRPPSAAGTAVTVTVADEPVRIARRSMEVRESYLEIFQSRPRRLVTGIEFLSPTNKRDRRGRQLYRRKQRTLQERGVNLVEVDLLRRGRHLLNVPAEVVEELRPWTYLVNIARRDTDEYEVYPLQLRERLPRVRIPLRPGEQDAVLNLQDVFGRAYDIGAFPEVVDYTAPPTPPLADDDAAWANDLLTTRGFRT